jgi:LacI family transcriptional regulator
MKPEPKAPVSAKRSAAADPTRRRKAATIRDVAHAAGVSIATVSKFMNGGQRFTREVEERMGAAVQALGYVSNPMARGMITGQTGNVGLVILDILNPHFTTIVKGASRVAQQEGLNLLFTDAAEGSMPELQMLQALSRRVDGLIVSARLSEASIDTVYYGGRSMHPECFSVGIDSAQAGLMLGRHLRDLGHRRIAYVGFHGARWSDQRWEGLQEVFAGTGAELQLFDVRVPDTDEGERIASAVLLQREQPDAVVAYNDLLALGLLDQAQQLGLSVPGDVSICGFDNIPYSRYTAPPLTTVDMEGEATGATAMRHLISRIRGETTGGGHEALMPRVLPRGSTQRRGGPR